MMKHDLGRVIRISGLLLMLSSVGGCLALATADEVIHPVNECTSDTDCSDHGGRCDTDLGACVSGAGVEESLVFFVSEPQGGSSGEERYDVVSANADGQIVFALSDTVLVTGIVADSREEYLPVASRLTFRRQTEFAGLSPEPTYAESLDRTDVDDHGQYINFSVRLVPGRYEVEIEPTQDSSFQVPYQLYYPLIEVIDVQSTEDTVRREFEYTSDTRIISSVVIGPEGEPTGGARVYALDSETGRRISNVAMTQCVDPGDEDSGCGRFSLALSPDVGGEILLRIRGSESQPLLPMMDHRLYYTFTELDNDSDGHLDSEEVGSIAYPELEPPVVFDTVVEGVGRDGSVSQLVGATLEFLSLAGPDAPGRGDIVFEASATTDEAGHIVAEGGLRGEGGVGIWLRPAMYQVHVTPPADGEFAAGDVMITVAPRVDGEEPPRESLAVGSRVLIEGSVVSPDGQPVPQARIEALNPGGMSFVATSDEFGRYFLLVDPGPYDLLIVPPEQTLLAWTRRLDQAFFEDSTLELDVGWGSPVNGVVVRESGRIPLENALVEAFLIRSSDEGDELLRFGRARSAEDGSFTVLVPSVPVESDPTE